MVTVFTSLSGLLVSIASVLPFVFNFNPLKHRKRARHIYAAVFVFLCSSVALSIPFAFPVLQLGHWNWVGKGLSICSTYALVGILPAAQPARRYLTYKQRPGSLVASMACTAVIVFGIGLVAAFSSEVSIPTLRTILYEATLPGLDEEAVYRAGFLGCLLAASARDGHVGRVALVRSVFLSSALFGLVHAITFSDLFQPHFDFLSFLYGTSSGLVLSFMTINSGSILFPIIAHNLANVLQFFVQSVCV